MIVARARRGEIVATWRICSNCHAPAVHCGRLCAAPAAVLRSEMIVPSPAKALLQRLPTLELARGIDVSVLSPETSLAPLCAATPEWLRSIVWNDFRIAVAFFVVAPLALLASSVYACRPGGGRSRGSEAALRCMTSYWQASSLLLITVLFAVEEAPAEAVTGLVAQAMIAASLWWWTDLSDDVEDAGGEPLAATFRAWRSAATVAAVGGVAVQVPNVPCVAAPGGLMEDASCAAWLEPPKFAAALVGVEPSAALGALAAFACGLYCAVLAYYCAVLLPAVGRKGRAPRPDVMNVASPLGAWRMLGFVGDQEAP